MNDDKNIQKKSINWFPGHMAKARREIEEKLKLIDIVIELIDARIPLSSKNPMFEPIIKHKTRLIVLTKEDLADSFLTKQWIDYYQMLGLKAISINLKEKDAFPVIKKEAQLVLKDKIERDLSRGLKPRPIRAMIIGIPNVGKSTLINRIAKRKAATVGNKPGVTKSQQWIKVGNDFELLDTPGILWPKFEDHQIGLNLAMVGSIKDTILPKDQLFRDAIIKLSSMYPKLVKNRYDMVVNNDQEIEQFIQVVGKKYGLLMEADQVDQSRAVDFVLQDIKDGMIGRITLEGINDESV